jgi:hypothetical protein
MIDKEKVRNFAQEPKITRLQFVFTIVGLLLFIFLGTSVFAGLSDGWKIVVYASFVMVALLANMSPSFKQMVNDIKEIWTDSRLSAEEKVSKIGNIVIKGLVRLGEAWEELNEEQGTSPN